MRKRYTFVANWKMYFDFNESINFVTQYLDQIISLADQPSTEIILCPSFTTLYPLIQILGQSKVKIGAQNCSDHIKGAYTGQVCIKDLSNLGVYSSLIGHSEIRRYKSETDGMIAQKFDLLLDAGISPILCVGESELDDKNGKTLEVLQEQLKKPMEIVSAGVKRLNGRPIYIAYEPEWSIGTGKVANNEKLEAVFAWIYNAIHKASPNSNWILLYGGSVDATNSAKIGKISYVSGFLIGKASTNFEEFEKIVKSTILENNN